MRFIAQENDHGPGWRVFDTALGMTVGSTYQTELEAQEAAARDERDCCTDFLYDLANEADHAESPQHERWQLGESQMWDG